MCYKFYLMPALMKTSVTLTVVLLDLLDLKGTLGMILMSQVSFKK